MRKVKSRLALLLAVIMIAGSLQLPVFAVRRSGAGIPSGASAEAGVEDPGQVTETELLDLVPDSAGTGGTEPQDPVDTTWTVIFDANGGTFPGGETQISLDVEKGLAVQFNSEPLTTADRYFAGWKTQDGTLINDAYSFVPENDITLYAFWKDKKKVENISLNHHELTMSVGKTAALSATVLPEDAYDRSFTWKSGNPGVAAVNNNGKVTAAAKGTAVIKAAANDGSGVFAECKITVRQPVTSLTLNKTSLTVNKGATSTLSATAGPSDANNKTVKWTTSDSSVATVSSAGEVKGVKRGTATITATAADGSGKKATCSVTVKQPVTSLTLNKTALTLNNGKTATLTATVGPSNEMDDKQQCSCDRLLNRCGQRPQERYSDDHSHRCGRKRKESCLQSDCHKAGDKPDAEQNGFAASAQEDRETDSHRQSFRRRQQDCEMDDKQQRCRNRQF